MILIFEDRGWTVATASWSMGSDDQKTTQIIYTWGADRISFFDSATGTARYTFHVPVEEFISILKAHANEGCCDLRAFLKDRGAPA